MKARLRPNKSDTGPEHRKLRGPKTAKALAKRQMQTFGCWIREFLESLLSDDPAPTSAPTPVKPFFLSPEQIEANIIAYQKLKFQVSIPDFNKAILDGYGQCDDLVADIEVALEDFANKNIKYHMNGIRPVPIMQSLPTETVELFGTVDSIETAPDGEDSFGTNNQEEDVDEADVVKSDGKFVYVAYPNEIKVLDLSGNEVFHLRDGFEGDIWSTSIKGLFLYENKLVALRKVNTLNMFFHLVRQTEIVMLDIDVDSGVLNITGRKRINGAYETGRMIDSNAHVVTSSSVDKWELLDKIHRFNEMYEGLNDTEYAEMAFDVAASEIPIHAQSILRDLLLDVESSNNESLAPNACQHIAKVSSYQNGLSDEDDRTDQDGILNTFVRVVSFDITSGLNSTFNTSASFSPSYDVDVYATSDKIILGARGWAATQESNITTDVTYVTAFELAGASSIPNSTGIIPGYTLNQFSFDYFNDYLRVATTTREVGFWNRTSWEFEIETNSTNQIVVAKFVNDEIQIVSMLEGLGETERIYSVRFLGNRAFMVTFRQIDPFYTIDLSDPENPVMKGELKIPGFSNYLHPVEDNFILAVGQDADENGIIQGLQVSLFNVSDLSNPVQMAKEVVDGWSYSSSQHDHRAFRYLPLTKKLILPISMYGNINFFDGFYVYDIEPDFDPNIEQGIMFDFNISHSDFEESNFCYSSQPLKPRSLVFDGDLMTLKGYSVLGHELASGNQLYKLEFEQDESDCWPWLF